MKIIFAQLRISTDSDSYVRTCATNLNDSLTVKQHITDTHSSSYTSAQVQMFHSHTQIESILVIKAEMLVGLADAQATQADKTMAIWQISCTQPLNNDNE